MCLNPQGMEATQKVQKGDGSILNSPLTEKENKWISGVVVRNLPP